MVRQCYPEKDVAGSSGGVICETELDVLHSKSSLERHFNGSIHEKNVGYHFKMVQTLDQCMVCIIARTFAGSTETQICWL